MAQEQTMSILCTWDMPIEDMTREHRKAMNEAHRAAGYAHWRHNIPKHFRASAAAVYGYNNRTAAYRRFKQKVYKSTVDLVKTGAMRREVTTTRPLVRATAYKCTVTIKLPVKGGTGRFLDRKALERLVKAGKRRSVDLTQKQRQGQVTVMKMVEEMRAVSKDDIEHLQNVTAGEYAKSINNPKPRQRSSKGLK